MQPGFIISRTTPVAVAPYALVTFNGTRGQVRQAAAATEPPAGVADSMGSVAGGMADLQLSLVADVVAGNTIAAGDPITADANGRAIKAVKQASVTVYVHGIAQEPAIVGDRFPMLIAPSLIVG